MPTIADLLKIILEAILYHSEERLATTEEIRLASATWIKTRDAAKGKVPNAK